MWTKNIDTQLRFTVNELCHEAANRAMSEETRRSLTRTSQLTISLGCGLVAGCAAAILSQVRILDTNFDTD